ncbi:MAG: lysophospholipid acyltransferase family protein [Chitinophagaceae bacterium]
MKKSFTYYFKEVFARIWAVWGLLSFFITFLIIFIPSMLTYLIKGNKGQYAFILVSKVWMRTWLFLIGCSLKIKGIENFKKGETYIITFNHNTLLDVPITCPFIPGANKTIAKSSFTKIPLFGSFYRKGAVLVDRKSDKSRRESYNEMKRVLAQKMFMCIYPEGTRNRTKDLLKPFYDGAFKLSAETKVAILPGLLFNTNKAQPNNKFLYLLPTKLEMHFLQPIAPRELTSKELRDEVFNVMLEYYGQHKNNIG